MIVSLIWRLEIWDEGVHRAMLPLKMLRKDLFRASLLASSSSLACGDITLIFSCHVHVCLCIQFSPFHEYICPTRSGHPNVLILTYLCLSPNEVTFWASEGWGTETPSLGTQFNLKHPVTTKPGFPTPRRELVLLRYAASGILFFLSTSPWLCPEVKCKLFGDYFFSISILLV